MDMTKIKNDIINATLISATALQKMSNDYNKDDYSKLKIYSKIKNIKLIDIIRLQKTEFLELDYINNEDINLIIEIYNKYFLGEGCVSLSNKNLSDLIEKILSENVSYEDSILSVFNFIASYCVSVFLAGGNILLNNNSICKFQMFDIISFFRSLSSNHIEFFYHPATEKCYKENNIPDEIERNDTIEDYDKCVFHQLMPISEVQSAAWINGGYLKYIRYYGHFGRNGIFNYETIITACPNIDIPEGATHILWLPSLHL